jgi:hypothetical protein
MREIIMKIYIKNMVAQGTRRFVLAELKKLGLKLLSFDFGEMEFEDQLSEAEISAVEISLGKYGLELLSEGSAPEQYSIYNANDSSKYVDDQFDTDEVMEIAEVGRAN